jgi:hypothetical protein
MIKVSSVSIDVNSRFASIGFLTDSANCEHMIRVDVITAFNVINYASQQGVKFKTKKQDQCIVYAPDEQGKPHVEVTLEKVASDAFNLVQSAIKAGSLLKSWAKDVNGSEEEINNMFKTVMV